MANKREKAKSKDKTKPSEPAKAADLMKMPPERTVRSVAADIRSTKNAIGGHNKELREVIAEAKKEKGIHPGALKLVESWVHKAKETDRGLTAIATMIAHLDFYRDVLGLDELLKQQGQMFERTEAGETPPAEAALPLTDARETVEEAGGPTIN